HFYTHAVDSIPSRNWVILEAGEYSIVCVSRKSSFSLTNDQLARIDLSDGSILAQYSGVDAEVVPLGGGKYLIAITAINTSNTHNRLTVSVDPGGVGPGTGSVAGDGTSAVYIYHAQVEDG